tara:strand:- start:177 stop:1166 length:990 start_codon:yes stop_codon:yes gene_type:complete
MANDKYHGYSPKKETTVPNEGGPGSGTRLDRVNPYEFRKGMDLELTSLGVSRLAESTVEEREKATETVLKNLEENSGYYSALIQFERGMNHAGPINEKTFKKYLENYKSDFPGTGMKEVKKAFQFGKMEDADHKNDKMEEPKYDKDVYTLKEAIKNEVNFMLAEVKGKEAKKINKADAEKEVSDEKSASKGAKGKEKALKALDKETETLNKEKAKNKEKLSAPLKRYKDGKLTADEYRDLSNDIVKRNKEINSRLSDIEKEKDKITLNEKMGRREVAKTMMEKDTHMEILNIVKEAGVNLREGTDEIKMYYEIAKTAYQEGFMAGLNKN